MHKSSRTEDLCVRRHVGAFQHSAAALIATLRSRKDHLDLVRVRVEGVSAATTEQLLREIERIGRDVALLEEQSRLSDEYKGWVLEAVNRYQLGFARGHQEAVDAELLFR